MKMSEQKDGKLVYPPGVRDITEDISTDDLVRRLKDCAQAFQNMSQEDDNSAYIPLALHLASETFLEHRSRDIRLLVACCIADVFRVYAPDAPYKDLTQLKVIFEFFVDQLKGLEDHQNPSFKRYFYLLENFSCVKTFNICVELEDNQKIICRLFKLMFKIISENHSAKVKKFILDMLSPLISEADVVSQELLDIILGQIIEPMKTQNRNACALAQDILKRNLTTIEPYIQGFFNNALILGKTLQSDVSRHLYELIYELNVICPSLLIVVLPQLEFKLKSNEEKERLDVTRVLARMFSDKHSNMVEENKTLWSCFLSRFNDISPQVRIRCVQYCKSFLLNHPEAKDDITEQLKLRHRDVDENVRLEVVSAIVNASKEDFSSVNEELLSFVKERTLDKKFKIRKEALLGLAILYKQHVKQSADDSADLEVISWVKNKVLHAYYQTTLEDRLLVERILHTCLVPYQRPMEERMKMLYQLFCSVDDHAVKAFKEILKCQSVLRCQMKNILEIIQCEKSENRQKNIANKVALLSKNLQDSTKSNEFILKFCNDLEGNLKLRNMMSVILNGNVTCAEAEQKVKDVLKMLGHPVQTNTYYMIIKQLLERSAPVMVDKEGIKHLVDCVKDSLLGSGAIEAELGLHDSSRRGLELLLVLTFVFPYAFHDEEIYRNLLLFLRVEDEIQVDMTLQIFMNICNDMEMSFPEVCVSLLPVLEKFAETGNPKQAKHAVYCINSMVTDRESVFGNIIENLKKHFTLKSQFFRTALVSVGHIAYLCHDMFAADFKTIVAKIVVKDLLMLDQDLPRGGEETWGPLDSLPDETKVKIEGMKVMVRWLAGLKDMVTPAMSTLRLLTTVILHGGDLMERQHTAPAENSWMRLSAATCMLKLCQEPNYAKAITVDQFVVLAYVMNDPCPEVRDRFAQKVHKGLFALKLPLEFLAVLCLAALDERKEFRNQVKKYILANINKRKEYIKHRILTCEKLLAFLPDYALPFAVYILAHAPFFKSYCEVSSLLKLKECLWLLMEPLMVKNENYNFSFFKRLLENIKQTKDKENPEDTAANMKLYAVCDLALGIVMSKTTNFILKEFPTEPALPSKLYACPDTSYSNLKTYLPPELICSKPLKSGFEIEIYEAMKDIPSSSETIDKENNTLSDTNVQLSQIDDDISDISHSLSERNHQTISSDSGSPSEKSKTRSKEISALEDSHMNSSSQVLDNEVLLKDVEETAFSSFQTEDSRTSDTTDNICSTSKKKVSKPVTKRPVRSSTYSKPKKGNPVLRNRLHSSRKQNGSLSSSDSKISSLCPPELWHLIKDCSVTLRKDDVERYTKSSGSASSVILHGADSQSTYSTDTPLKETSGSETSSATKGKYSSRKNSKNNLLENKRNLKMIKNNISNSPSSLNKRKREMSPVVRSVRSKPSNLEKNDEESVASSISSKNVEKNSQKSVQSSKERRVVLQRENPDTPSASVSKKVNNSVKINKVAMVNGSRGSRNVQKAVSQKSAPKPAKNLNLRQSKKAELKPVSKRR